MSSGKKVWNIISTILVVLVVLCAVFLMGSRLLGFRCFNIISPSMAPKYEVGDLIYVKKVSPEDIKERDVITFVVNEDLDVATHRVVRVDRANKQFFTKGDANDAEDGAPVHYNNVIGVPQFSIPKLGYVSDFIQNPPGTYIAVGAGLILLLVVFLPDMLRKKKTSTEAESEENADSPAPQVEEDSVEAENQRLKEELEKLKAEMAEKNTE